MIHRSLSNNKLTVSEHLYQATLAKKKALEQQILNKKVANEIKEMEECTFKPVMATAGKNFSHQDRQGSSFFERNQVWKEQVDQRVHNERNDKEREQKKECKFAPAIRNSQKSYTKGIKETNHLRRTVAAMNDPFSQGAQAPIDNVIKGLDKHMSRIMTAKARKE